MHIDPFQISGHFWKKIDLHERHDVAGNLNGISERFTNNRDDLNRDFHSGGSLGP
jgi:hypothetical protein